MSPASLIIFDVDGTLIDSQNIILAAMDYAFGQIGRTVPDRATALSVVGLSLPEAMATLAPDLPETETLRLVDFYRDSFITERASGGAEANAPLYPGARDALVRLAQEPGTLLGVATGKARRGLDHVFALHDLGGFFVTAQTSDDHPSKPHPSMLLTTLAETGRASGEGVMIGDTEFDILMGRAAGFATIGVAWGYHPTERLHAAGADLVIAHFNDLDAALAELRSRTA